MIVWYPVILFDWFILSFLDDWIYVCFMDTYSYSYLYAVINDTLCVIQSIWSKKDLATASLCKAYTARPKRKVQKRDRPKATPARLEIYAGWTQSKFDDDDPFVLSFIYDWMYVSFMETYKYVRELLFMKALFMVYSSELVRLLVKLTSHFCR